MDVDAVGRPECGMQLLLEGLLEVAEQRQAQERTQCRARGARAGGWRRVAWPVAGPARLQRGNGATAFGRVQRLQHQGGFGDAP